MDTGKAAGFAAKVVLAFAVCLAAGMIFASPAMTAQAVRCPLPEKSGPHPGMVWVPGGELTMGDNVYREEGPLKKIKVEGFWMDRHEVTFAQFAEFVRSTKYVTVAERALDPRTHPNLPAAMLRPGAMVFVAPNAISNLSDLAQWWRYKPGANWRQPSGAASSPKPRPREPVVAVAYEDALAYARWKGCTLPSEAQWEWAAREADPNASSPKEQPRGANTWQGIFPIFNAAEDGYAGAAPAGCFPPNRLGLSDMIGNVWEWTADVYLETKGAVLSTQHQAAMARTNLASLKRVIKGGSFLCAHNYCRRYRAGARQAQESDLAANHLGFRTILIAPGP
jgi:formylglycine-generating enzyme required for sulfatase activity